MIERPRRQDIEMLLNAWAVDGEQERAELAAIALRPGENRFLFTSDRPAVKLASGDPRPLAFCLRNLALELRPAPAP